MSLIDDVPEAKSFLMEQRNSLAKLSLFPDEIFSEVSEAVFGSSSIDSQGETGAIENLHSVEASVKEAAFWITVEHDPRIHPMGRILAAKVFFSPKDNIWFLAGLIGSYDASKLPSLSSAFRSQEAPSTVDSGPNEAHLCHNVFEIPKHVVRSLLEDAPDGISNLVFEERRKSGLVVLAILTLVIPGAWLKGFGEKFGGEVGTAFGKKFTQAAGWLGKKVVTTLRKEISSPLVLVEGEISGCKVQFVIGGANEAEQIEAAELIPEHATAAVQTLEQLSHLMPERLVFEYDSERKKWIPSYAITRKAGVLTDRPYLTVIHAKGLSLASRKSQPTELSDGPE